MPQPCGRAALRGDAWNCTGPTLVGRGLKAFALGLLVMFVLAAPAAAQPHVGACFSNDNCDDNNPCTVDTCDGPFVPTVGVTCRYSVAPAATVCRPAAGPCDAAETCGGLMECLAPDLKRAPGTVCSSADPTRLCDANDTCDGVSNFCVDRLAPAGTVCRASQGDCDRPEVCSGQNADCGPDTKHGPDVVCRPVTAPGFTCDVAESCNGTANACPADGVRPAGFACRPSEGACDPAELCNGSSAICPDQRFEPSTTVCRPAAGACDVAETCTGQDPGCRPDVFQPNGTSCTDGNACTTSDVCANGACTGGSAVVCNDGNACTADSCDPSTGCRSSPVVCNDNNACTTDSCNPSTGCGFAPISCNDGNACTTDTCNPAIGCTNVAISCNDNNACTTDACDPATGCTSTPVSCDDGNACNGLEQCNPANGSCTAGTPLNCSDNNACNGLETCNSSTGACNPGTPVQCGDGNACNGQETCNPSTGTCQAGTPLSCPDDGNACTTNTCDPAAGCVARPASSQTVCRPSVGDCDAAEFCTGSSNTCPADGFEPATTVCRPASGQCDVEEKCTGASAYCPVNGHRPNGTSCNDGLFCTGANNTDSCNQGVCGGAVNACNDGNACTTDVCNEDTNSCDQSPNASSSCDGKMTGGGQIGCPDCNAGRCSRHNNRNKITFGFNAEGEAQTPSGQRGGAKGRFNYVNHATGVKIKGPVTFIHYAVPSTNGGEMRFEVSARQHHRDDDKRDKWDDDDEDNDCSHICKYDVTARDQAEPGHKAPYDFLKVEYRSGSCAPENTGDQPLKKGNIQWHDTEHGGHHDDDDD